MTIAVGVLASSGVVLAADTQLTIPGFWKGEGGKIMATARRKAPTGVLAVTGATNIYEYLHGLGDDLTRDFLDGLDTAGKTAAYDRFGIVLRRFYRRHVFPVAGEAPDVQVLMAYQRGEEIALWQSAKNTLIEQYEYGAVGLGAFAANAWLARMWKGRLDNDLTKRIAEIRAMLRDSTPAAVTSWRQQRWERLKAESDLRRSKVTSPDQPPSPEVTRSV